MNIETFLSLSSQEIAGLVNADSPQVCACPINGTRRWFALEHGDVGKDSRRYLQVVLAKYVDIFRLLYSHGLNTLLSPIFDPELLLRGDVYAEMAMQGMKGMIADPVFMQFVRHDRVRVRFYGDYVRYFRDTRHETLIDLFAQLAEETQDHDRYRLFFGVCAHDAAENVAQFGAEFYRVHQSVPSRREIVENYYGEYVEPISIFIGFNKLSVFDMPLLATGNEDLYFMTCPTPYLSEHQLRLILFDHLYLRKGELDYTQLTIGDWNFMRRFYQANREKTIGVGTKLHGIWYPKSQVEPEKNFILDGDPQ